MLFRSCAALENWLRAQGQVTASAEGYDIDPKRLGSDHGAAVSHHPFIDKSVYDFVLAQVDRRDGSFDHAHQFLHSV